MARGGPTLGLLLACAACGPPPAPGAPVPPGPHPVASTEPSPLGPDPEPVPPSKERIFAHPSGVRFGVAEGWASEIDEDSMSLVSGDESAMLMFFIVDAVDVEAAVVGLREILAGVVDDPRMGEGKERELNGLSAYAVRGKGSVKATPVDLGIALVETPSGRVLIVLGIADEDAPPAIVRQIDETVKSIRPHAR